MARRRVTVRDAEEMLAHWQAGRSIRSIAGSLGTSRPTIRKYVAIAEGHGYQVGGSPPPGGWRAFFQEAAPEVFNPGLGSTIFAELRSRHDDIKESLAHTNIMTAWQRLRDDEPGIKASYSSFRRYVMKHLPEMAEGTPITVRRDDPPPGEEASLGPPVLYIFLNNVKGKSPDRNGITFVLSHSRHM